MAIYELQPPTAVVIPEREPVIFLAGPIQGAPLWQPRAIELIASLVNTGTPTHVANPRRSDLDKETFVYAEQVAWEKHHLVRAAKHGAVIFWFAAQDPTQPYETGRAYAQTSRIEFGRVLGWKDYNPSITVAMGIEPGYIGSQNYYQSCALEMGIPVFNTLEDTCIEAARSLK